MTSRCDPSLPICSLLILDGDLELQEKRIPVEIRSATKIISEESTLGSGRRRTPVLQSNEKVSCGAGVKQGGAYEVVGGYCP